MPWFWSDQHDYTLQVAGLASAADREARDIKVAEMLIAPRDP